MMELCARKVRYGAAHWPLLNNGEHITLNVMEHGRCLATVLTGVDRRAVRLSGELRGHFAGFAAQNRPDAICMLAAGVADWQRAQGMRSVFGPVATDGSGFMMGVQVSGFERPWELLNPVNPVYYDALLCGAGFTSETDWLSFDLDLNTLRKRRLVEAADWACARHDVSVSGLDPLKSRRDCGLLRVAMGMTDLFEESEFADRLARLKPWLDPRLTLVATRKGVPCGLLMGLRDKKSGHVRIATAHIDEESRRSFALVCLMGSMVRALEAVRPVRITASVIDAQNQASLAVCRGAGGVLTRAFRQYTLST